MTSKRLLAFAKAWDAKDLEKIMAFFTEDCRYSPSVVGEKRTYQGKDEVRLAIAGMIALDNTVVSRVQNININGAFGFWEWEYTSVGSGVIQGCDVFEFKNDRIRIKNAYRKIVAV